MTSTNKPLQYHYIRIISDSLNSINWILGLFSLCELRLLPLVERIRKNCKLLYEGRSITTILQWTESHINTMGNDLADFLAKAATRIIQLDYAIYLQNVTVLNYTTSIRNKRLFTEKYPKFITNNWTCTSMQMDQNLIKSGFRNFWFDYVEYYNDITHQYNSYHKKNSWWGHIVHVSPNIRYRKDFKRYTRLEMSIINNARCNRLHLNSHLYYIGIINSPHCVLCSDLPETNTHYLLNCPMFHLERSILFDKLETIHCTYFGINTISWKEIKTNQSFMLQFLLFPIGWASVDTMHVAVTDALLSYIKSTKRFTKEFNQQQLLQNSHINNI